MTLADSAVTALVVTAVCAVAALLVRALTVDGVIAGAVVGACVSLGFGLPGLAVLGTFFVVGTAATRVGWEKKKLRGTAEAGEGRRDWKRVVGKGGVAAAIVLLWVFGIVGLGRSWCTWVPDAAFAGAVSAALADTLGTEIGTLSTGPVWTLPRMRRVPTGTPGAVSLVGTLAAVSGAFLVANVAYAVMYGGYHDVVVRIAAAGVIASLAESMAVGLGLRAPGFVRNLFTTLVGACIAGRWGFEFTPRMIKLGAYVALARPFTLLAPAMGMLAYGLAAIGYGGSFQPTPHDWRNIALGAVAAALLNVASNAVNQIFDVEIDRTNKPDRPLPSGALSIGEAWVVTVAGYAGSLAISALIAPELLWIVAFTALLTYAYSGPPFRTKRHWAFANLTIATPRGFLLPIAGWMAVSAGRGDAVPRDAWILAAASGLFVVGAATTKDYADMEGDRAGGCITLPLRFGVERSVNIVAPFLVLPWLVLATVTVFGVLAGNHFVLFWGSMLLGAVGLRAVRLLVRDPQALTGKSTHPSWVLMYLLMVLSQAVAALAYALPANLLAGWAP